MNSALHLNILEDLLDELFSEEERSSALTMERGLLQIEPQELQTPAEVQQALVHFAPDQGWIQTTNQVLPGDQFARIHTPVLSAEVVRDSRSLHIRQNGQGGWLLVTMETIDGDGLIMEHPVFGRKPFKTLTYHVGWRLEETTDKLKEWRPYAARLVSTDAPPLHDKSKRSDISDEQGES